MEDRFGASYEWFWVADGASDPEPCCTFSAERYVQALGSELSRQLTGPSLIDATARAIEHAATLHRSEHDAVPPPSGPSAAMAVAQVMGGRLSWLGLGDIAVLVATRSRGVRLTIDRRLAEVATEERGALRHLRAKGRRPGDAAYDSAWKRLTLAERRLRNQSGGYWICADDPKAAKKAFHGSMPIGDVRGLALLSDGAHDILSAKYQTGELLWDFLAKTGPHEALNMIRSWEMNESSTGKSDDATILMANLR